MTPDTTGCTHRADGGAALHILVDPSGYHCRNIGDTAMLQVALNRLRSFWPRAVIQIQSLDCGSVRMLEPDAQILNPSGSFAWSAASVLAGAWDVCRLIRRHQPRIAKGLGSAALRVKRRDPALIDEYLSAVKRADLVLLSGAGALNDAFVRHALPRLETLELAMEAGAVTALVGQGIGPMSNSTLRRQAARILPHVDFISLRDGIGSLTLLDAIGVPNSRVMVTGDDAVEMGYQGRADTMGAAIGVNCRIAHYSGVDQSVVERIGEVVRESALPLGASLLPLPISRYTDEDDLRTARLILHDSTELNSQCIASPSEFLRALPACRIVVSGSYHAAVFALSMGIPAVVIAGCDYYVHKFRGLAHQFGPGCQVELTSHPHFEKRLRASIDAAWHAAPKVRQSLLRASVRQVTEGKAAYRRLFGLVESRVRTAGWLPRHSRPVHSLSQH